MGEPVRGAGTSVGLVMEPPGAAWPSLIGEFVRSESDGGSASGTAGAVLSARKFRDLTRRELGLPTDRPIILTGHQAMVWHPGILAKYLAVEHAAKVTNSAGVWLVVDQDSEDPWAVRYPSRARPAVAERTLGTQHGLTVESMRFPPRLGGADTPAASLAPLAPVAGSDFANGASESVRQGLARIHAALSAHSREPNAGRQLANAIADLLAPLHPAATIFGAGISRTTVFASVVRAMAGDPERCVHAYNAAVARFPAAKLRPLAADDVNVRYELPLWRIEFGRERRRVYAEELDQIPIEQLAPRALLMTGLLRAAACDLFVHGLGGGVYESVTDAWFGTWLVDQIPGLALAPVAVVSATLRLPLIDGAEVNVDDLARARWRAHRAPHDPTMLGDDAAGHQKTELVRRIEAEKAGGGDPRSIYLALHASLTRVRTERAKELAAIQAEVDAIAGRVRDAEIASDRTWAFPLYPREMLDALDAAVRAAFAN